MYPLCKPFFTPAPTNIAILAVCTTIFSLAYTSQYLFYYIEPGPLSASQAIWFNLNVFFIWLCYYRACTTDAAPRGWVSKAVPTEDIELEKIVRWCKKCRKVKPPRAHHCKICATCVPKMDHHCPWTVNCVSYLTFPHYLRFLFYSVISMSILAYHLSIRLHVIWQKRYAPAYLGPPVWTLVHLLVLLTSNSLMLFMLSILLIRVIFGLATNTTMIECWEIERHEVLVNRYRRTNGYISVAGGQHLPIEHQEFPYDIGMWKNVCQSMGTRNFLMWLMPFGGTPAVESAGTWEVNGFEDEGKVWPPSDPEKMRRYWPQKTIDSTENLDRLDEEGIAAFKARQNYDLRRRGHLRGTTTNESFYDYDEKISDANDEFNFDVNAETSWKNSDGDRLEDYGVDEDETEVRR
ncbi:Palmitoyltransferase pfa4 [Golovinomyces cichoracearum]|uniref:Palmitoyltransferase PFA4 n=1 Tax=Golovinomyces cichoracearum TaxID=62708 RepID=A0A420JAC4_9PEZI|nr:Palmitoyltransferase pfa4 [Golovinomyces cichoracearum]